MFAPAARLTDEQRQNVQWQRYPQLQPSQRPTPDFEPTLNKSFTDRRERPRPRRWSKLDAQRLRLMSDEVLVARIAAAMVRNGVPGMRTKRISRQHHAPQPTPVRDELRHVSPSLIVCIAWSTQRNRWVWLEELRPTEGR